MKRVKEEQKDTMEDIKPGVGKRKYSATVKTEEGQSSGAQPSDHQQQPWAKLVPSDSRYESIKIRSNDMVITSQITSAASKMEWCQIVRNPDRSSATIKNKRPNAIIVDGLVLQCEQSAGIKCGSLIIPASVAQGCLTYKFELMAVEREHHENKLKIFMDAENTKCSICLSVWHDVVTVAPCLHNFCNGCFSEWLKRCQQKRASVVCPQCRAVVQCVGRNHFLHNIEEDILNADASVRRSKEDLALLDSQASIQSNLVISSGRGHPTNGVPVQTNHPCLQCGIQFGGFLCDGSTVHLQCQGCGGMMPSRADVNIPQHCNACLGCNRAFCGAYWLAQGIPENNLYPRCNPDTFKRISERTVDRVPPVTHERNQFEQDITVRSITQLGKTLQDVITEWVTKLNSGEIDRSRLPLSRADSITANTHICNDCYGELVSFLLYWFRVSLPNHALPPDALNREDCWYGYTCYTQHNSVHHARRRNHVCQPTRGTQS